MAQPPPAATMEKSTSPDIEKTTTKKTTTPKTGKKITAVEMPQSSPPSITVAAEPIPQPGQKSGAPLIDVRNQSLELHNIYRSRENASNMLYMVSTHYIIMSQ